MYFYKAFFVLVFSLGILTGCASSPPATTTYDSSKDVTTYETKPISLPGVQIGGSSFGGGTEASIRALGKCKGANCQLSQVEMVFQVSGSSDLRMENPPVELSAGKLTVKSMTSDQGAKRRAQEIEAVTGEVARLQLSVEEFRHFAKAEEISGSLSSWDFTLSRNDTKPLRLLMRKAEMQETQEEAK